MDNRIGKQTSRTLRRAAAVFLLTLALPGAAQAFVHDYNSISMPGSFNGWSTSADKLELVANHVWQGVVGVSNGNEFKFSANESWDWDKNWGLLYTVSEVPSEGVGPLDFGGSNIKLAVPSGKYRFVFFEDTKTFSVLATNVPAYTSVQLVGNFNGDGAQTNGTMTQTSTKGVWTTTVDLEYGATFRVLADGAALGAHSVAAAAVDTMPGTLALYGTTEATLASRGGTFVFTADFRSNLLTVVQTATNGFTTVAASADGTFACGTKTPGQNLEDQGSGWWQGDFHIEQDSFTLRFAGRDANGLTGGRWWGFPAGTILSVLPVSTNLAASDTSAGAAAATVTAGAGDYTFRFNIQSGECTIRKRDRGNLLKNPSFEALDGNGNPADWGIYHGNTAPAASYDAHSGTNSVVLNRLYEDWDNLGNIDQNVTLKNLGGQPFVVSAAFRCGGTAWHGDTVRIIIEWKESPEAAEILSEESVEVLNIGPAWQTVPLETVVPTNKATLTAHILFKYDGAQIGETLLVDDAFAGIAASRDQNFDAWGKHDDFGPLSPDWTVDSGKTILNAGEKVYGGVVISKYIEGTGNNKAIELFNGTPSNINFKTTPYYLQQYDNGSATPTVTIPLTNGTFYAGRCWRVTRTFTATNYPPDKALKAANYCTTNDLMTFNGDDVVVLRRSGTNGPVVDRVGQVSANATGSLWSRMATDHTLVRNSTVTNGSTDISAAFDLAEWTVLDRDDFTGLGTHSFTDPNASGLPSGYSLLLDTNACLSTPSFDGGLGDITFLARAQAAPGGGPLTLLVESAADEYSTAWTLVASNSIPASQTEFTRYECAAVNGDHTAVRFRHVSDGSTNRVRLDDISVGRHFSVKRTENFSGWTDPAYATDGLYSIAQWTLNGHIAANGVSTTRAGNLPVDGGYVRSPTFAGGVGQVSFTLCRTNTSDTVQVSLESSADGGSTWTEEQSFKLTGGSGTSTNLSSWVYIPSNGCVRFFCNGGTADAILDNISIGMPSIPRVVNFDDLPVTGSGNNFSYSSYSYKGWSFTDTCVYGNDSRVWSGNSGLIRYGTLTSPRLDTIGSISFVYCVGPGNNDDSAKLKVEVSTNGTSWTTLTNGLAPASDWRTFGYWFPTNSNWHYVRITQTVSGKRILIDDINLADFSPVPSVSFSSGLDPAYPTVKESFRLTAAAYPRNGADILSVTGYVKYVATGNRWTELAMTDEGAGDWASEPQPGRNGGNIIVSKATVWYGGVGVVDGNPGYAVTNFSTPATTVTVSSVKSGEVWINELSYERLVPPDDETDDWGWQYNQDHEFVEICGKAGTDIGNWKIQLAYALSGDIAAHSNQAIYATYAIPAGTKIPDTGNGYGFWLLADSYVVGRNQTLDTLEPLDAEGWGDMVRSHIRDAAGVVRLVNQYGGVMQSVSYGAYADSSEHLPVSQVSGVDNATSIALGGTGGLYSDFSWASKAPTPGTVNAGQTLDGSITTDLMPIWHDPTLSVTTRLQGAFFLFDPENAPQSAAVQVFFAYTNSDFPSYNALGGTLHHRLQGTGTWRQAAKQNDFSGNNNPTNGEAYFAFQALAPYAYHRRDTMEYVIEASAANYADTFLGTEDGTTSVAYETLDEAKQHPFTHYFPLSDHIVITNFAFADDGSFVIQTTGDDPLDRLSEFNVLGTTNLAIPVENWEKLDFSRDGINESDTFTIPAPPEGAAHFAIQPVR